MESNGVCDVSAEVEALRRASLVKAFSHTTPVVCLSSSKIQEFEDSLYFPRQSTLYQIFNT